ncbi:hypothetical protein [Salipaludibacillus neizhouensis]|nr:hypothetical protein [Salipaludibacillus neizhouensis]
MDNFFGWFFSEKNKDDDKGMIVSALRRTLSAGNTSVSWGSAVTLLLVE